MATFDEPRRMKGLVLDVGCSTQKYPGAIGIDIAKGGCDVQASAEYLPFKSSAFDLVHARRLLYIMPNEELTFSEMVRVARPGAKLMVYNSNWVGCLFYKLRWFKRKGKRYRHMRIYTKQSVAKLARKFGLVNIKTLSEKIPYHKLSDIRLDAYKPLLIPSKIGLLSHYETEVTLNPAFYSEQETPEIV